MAWTNVGFDGTINEAEWSRLSGLLGNSYVAAGNGDCLVTAVPGARSVSVAAGSLYGDGVLSTNSGAETVAMTTPVNGQWFVIALRRTWASNSAALVAIAGATTTTTTPTAPPTSFPTLNTNVGVLTDQPIAWAWCNSANTTVVVYDIRLKAVKSLPPVVANANERDAKFMSPTQGLQVWRDDLGAVETYFGLYNASTNPGGRDSAGWYVTNRASAMLPMRPTGIVAVSGTATLDSLNKVTFTNVTSISLNGCMPTTPYKRYKVIYTIDGCSASSELRFRLRNGTTDYTSNYAQGGFVMRVSGSNTAFNGSGLGYLSLAGTAVGTAAWNAGEVQVYNPSNTDVKAIGATGNGYEIGVSPSTFIAGGHCTSAGSADGITLLCTSGTMTGTVSVIGIVD